MISPDKQYDCPIKLTLDAIGGKYKSLIIWQLNHKTVRFNALHRALPDISPKVLTQQLREMEMDGLISREAYPTVPPKVEYSLTPLGYSVIPIMEAMCDWGRDYMNQSKSNQW
ncbi:MAG: helix-turn-helix domain-containing protein [bacterium]|nr:helix-turn-helix domain-containing protein [bacterium]